ncbi:MAG: hypothetical protein AB1578_14140 [Thermodesulfobacteriota bacterium]
MAKNRFRAVAGAAAALWMALVPGGAAAQADAVLPAPVPVEARLTSALSDPYYVLTGPVETYRGYRLERRFGRLLEAYARRKSGAGSPPLVLTVHLESLTTGYHQIGRRDRERRYRAALPRTSPELLLASAGGPEGSLARLRRFGGLDRDGGDLSIPYEITKRAVLTAVVAVTSGGDTLARETVTREAVEVISWEDYDRWAYDYGGVLEGAFRQVLAEADRLVDDAVAVRGR